MSMAGSVGGLAAQSAAKGVTNGVSQAIGKPLESLSTPGSARQGTGEINWVHFNYPPVLRLIHYDLEELPSTLSGLVRRLNISFQLTTFSCMLNLFDTLVIVFSTEAPKKWLLQSLLHLVMLPAAALAVFYAGYRGLAEPDGSLLTKYKVGQPILGFIYFLMALVPFGCANGLAMLGKMSDYTDGSVFWTVVILAESFFWAVNVLFAVLNLYRAHIFNQYGASGATLGGNRF